MNKTEIELIVALKEAIVHMEAQARFGLSDKEMVMLKRWYNAIKGAVVNHE